MQSYTEITDTMTLTASRPLLLNNDKSIMSCFSGTAFPTINLQVGMLCLRTDTWQLWQLKDATPTWVLIADISKTYLSKETADTYYAALAHNHNSTYAALVHNHDGGAITAGTVASARLPAPLQQITAAVNWGAVTIGGVNGGWAGINFSGTGMYFLVGGDSHGFWTGSAWKWHVNNGVLSVGVVPVANVSGLGSAATCNTGTAVGNVPAVQADGKLPASVIPVDLSSRVAKSGDTMTGQLNGTVFKSTGASSASTGFKISTGADLGALFKDINYTAVQTVSISNPEGWCGQPTSLSVSGGISGNNLSLGINCNCLCNCGG
ncbi:hypothetical protein [Magnetospirillum molischianum]|uniref:Uncharacterized protein n=1 Tax=Magnetospirillum molischianum DSM 120 TaxID=1150626 RepID=H8FY65_MAGML|nr:hypothetical protein [Magnetospirillum molischianum]CCG43303.1 hypothetical protein PHAMO_80094 [Magnetospirillum molischianum DSM 120]